MLSLPVSILLRRLLSFMALPVVLSALSACQLMEPFQRPVNPLPEQYALAFEQQDRAAIQGDWWELYQDPQLNTLMQQALDHNPNIAIAVARIEQVDAAMREVGAALLPEVGVQANASEFRVTERGQFPIFPGFEPRRSTFTFRLASSFEIDFWGKLRAAKQSARANAMASREAKQVVLLSLQSVLVQQYIVWRGLQSQIDLINTNIALRQESLSLTQRRLQGGVASSLDVHQAQAAVHQLQALLSDLQRQQALAQHQLALLTGNMQLPLAPVPTGRLPNVPIAPVGLPSRLMDARPDIRQAEQALIAAQANLAVAKAALYPSIALTGFYGSESLQLSQLLDTPARIWGVGLGLNLPIFNGGRLQAKVDQVTAAQKQLLAQYEAVLQSAFQEVNDALVNVRQQGERQAALAAALSAATQALGIANQRYQAGYSAYLDVLDAQRVLNEASLAHTQAQQAQLEASVSLFKALGGGWQAEKGTPP